MTESINRLVDICTSGAPWQKECDQALRQIQQMYHLLDNPSEPVNDCSYFECLEVVTEKSRVNSNLDAYSVGIDLKNLYDFFFSPWATA